MTTWEERVKSSRFVRLLKIWLSNIILPGFHGVSLYDSLNFFGREIFSTRFAVMARSVSFSFLMSLPPFLLFLFTLIPYLPLSDESLISSIEETVGIITQSDRWQKSVTALFRDFFLHKKEVLLSFSVLMTLFFSSNGMMGLMTSFDRSFAGFKKQFWYTKRLWAILLTIIFIIVIIVSFSLMIFQVWLFNYAGIHDWVIIGKILQYIIIAAMLVFTISIVYKYGPSTHSRWPLITAGSILSSALIIIVTVGFFYVVNNLVNYNQILWFCGNLDYIFDLVILDLSNTTYWF